MVQARSIVQLLAVLMCIMIIVYSIVLQRAARNFILSGLTGCVAIDYFESDPLDQYLIVEAGDTLSSSQLMKLDLTQPYSHSPIVESNTLAKIVHVTSSRQRLLIDTISGFVASARSRAFPSGNIHIYLIDPTGSEMRQQIKKAIEHQYGVIISTTGGEEYITQNKWPFQYTIMVNAGGRIVFSSQSLTGCSIREYIDAYYTAIK